MLLQAKNKKGLSIVIGYVLLIAISIVMSILVYQWLKTYVPTESLKCDDGTNLLIKSVLYNCTNFMLTVDVKNNGKFSIDGYYIHVSKTSEGLAIIDLSNNLTSGGSTYGNAIRLSPASHLVENILTPDEPNNEKISSFNTTGYGTLQRIEIIPTRFQDVSGKKRFISCSDSKVEAVLNCVH
jgi:FlaG/FlaF family flagellin (archaellin)